MRPSAALRLRALGCTLLTGATLLAVPAAPAAAAPDASKGLSAEVAQLNRDIARVGDELAEGAKAYEAAAEALARRTQEQFAARADAEARQGLAADTRGRLDGLARAAYKGGLPPMVTALLSGDPRTVGDLAYVQRSINVVGVDRREQARTAYLSQAGASKALAASDASRRAALADREALDAQVTELAAKADRLSAELSATAERLAVAKAVERARDEARAAALSAAASKREAERVAAAAARAAAAAIARNGGTITGMANGGVPGIVVTTQSTGQSTGGGAGCQLPSAFGEANGFLSDIGLCPLQVGGGHRLRTDAAQAFNALAGAYASSLGTALCVTDSYRSYAEQVDVFKRKPGLAATPGRSQHGWGLAVDLCGGIQTFGSAEHEWMRMNAWQFGWIHPAWAQRGGSKPEAWHWEFVGARR